MPNFVWALLIALVVSLVITPAVILFADKTGAMDAPDARKVHKKPIPRIGGLGIYIAFMAGVLATLQLDMLPEDVQSGVIGLLIGATLIVILGLVDDYKNLPPKVKLLGQIVAAGVLVAFGVQIDFIADPFGDY
ncbi:UDP-phosphate N-acetylglucosaminyl 1-phosphate transferase, partial [Anaerovibrio lipolyticus]